MRPLFPNCSVRGNICSKRPALHVPSVWSANPPRLLCPRNAEVHCVRAAVTSDLSGPSAQAVQAGRFFSQAWPPAEGLFINTNCFLMTKVILAGGLKIYIQPKKKVQFKGSFSSTPAFPCKVSTVSSQTVSMSTQA